MPRRPAPRTARTVAPPRPPGPTRNLHENPLAWLAGRGLIGARQLAAGERLREDFYAAGTLPSVTMRWSMVPGGGGGGASPPDRSAGQLGAKARFETAVSAAGPGLSDILWRVVCAGEGLDTAERGLGWPARAGKLVLGIALDRVADHYRL